MKSHYEKFIRRYFMACSILGTVLVLLWIIACLTMGSYIGVITSLPVLLIIMKLVIRIIANKTLLSLLLDELDAYDFQKIVNDKRFVSPLTYRINAAISIGDYQTVVNIATKQIRKENCSIKVKYYYLCILARVYFELRDFEKLKALVTKYEEYKEQYPSKSFLKTPNSAWSYYRYFLEHNYDACRTICAERNLELKPKARNTKVKKLQNEFFYAVACYENGEIDVAKESFESIISFAPRMYIASVSQKYLEAVKQNQLPLLSDTEVLPDDSFQIYDERTAAKIRRNKIITRIGILIVVVLFALASVLDYIEKKENDEISPFEVKLNDALAEKYGEAAWIDHFGLEKDGVYADSLCLAKNGNELVLVEVVSYDKEETFDVLVVVEDIQVDSYYCVKGPSSNHYIGFLISTNEIDNDDFYYRTKFEFNEKNYWLNIDYVETYPKE